MPHKIILPTLLRTLTGGTDMVEVEAKTVNDLLETLENRYPGFRSRICEENGELRRFINIYLDGEDVRFLDNLATSIPEGSEVSIIPAIAGG